MTALPDFFVGMGGLEEAVMTALGILVGFATIYAFKLVQTPYTQRDEARAERLSLQSALAKREIFPPKLATADRFSFSTIASEYAHVQHYGSGRVFDQDDLMHAL